MSSSLQKDLPYFAEGTVVAGFGRGGKELGIPTANFPEDVVKGLPASFECGVYYGWAKLLSDDTVYRMVMSIGWNPYYHNTMKTMETHIMHKFDHDFYGDHLKVIVLGYIRPMTDFKSLDDLKLAIRNDIDEANKLLEESACLKYAHDPFFTVAPITAPSAPTTVSSAPTAPITAPSTSIDAITVLASAENSKCTQNGILTSVKPDSPSFDKYTQKRITSSSKSCESDQMFKSKHVKDEPCYPKNLQGRHCSKTSTNPNKDFIKSGIILSDLSEAEDTKNICRLPSEDVYTIQKVF